VPASFTKARKIESYGKSQSRNLLFLYIFSYIIRTYKESSAIFVNSIIFRITWTLHMKWAKHEKTHKYTTVLIYEPKW
jgi:hypothetical protein